jgi:NTP pyrophosphatase (non-canonical NTP hydrolase)
MIIENTSSEILDILQEEGAEVIQAVSKCRRFGLDNHKPGKPLTNRQHLAEELGDLLAMITLCHDFGIVDFEEVMIAKDNKLEKLRQWSNIFTDQTSK